jgi:hypothetical protein
MHSVPAPLGLNRRQQRWVCSTQRSLVSTGLPCPSQFRVAWAPQEECSEQNFNHQLMAVSAARGDLPSLSRAELSPDQASSSVRRTARGRFREGRRPAAIARLGGRQAQIRLLPFVSKSILFFRNQCNPPRLAWINSDCVYSISLSC